MGKSERPEHTAPPDIYYNAEEARKYTTNSRIMQIQVQLCCGRVLLERTSHASHNVAPIQAAGLPQQRIQHMCVSVGVSD